MTDEGFDELIWRYLDGEASEADLAQLRQWLTSNREAQARFVRLTTMEAGLRGLSGAGRLTGLSALGVGANEGGHHERVRARARNHRLPPARRIGWMAAAAATIALLVGIAWWSMSGEGGPDVVELAGGLAVVDGRVADAVKLEQPFEVAAGAAAELRLDDGSVIRLAAQSQATLKARDGRFARYVALERGEGQFEVKPGDGQFTVRTPVGDVTALGTKFRVKLQPDQVKGDAMDRQVAMLLAVVVLSGTVEVNIGGEPFILGFGGEAVFAGDREGEGSQRERERDGARERDGEGEREARRERRVRGTIGAISASKIRLVWRGDRGERSEDYSVDPRVEVIVDKTLGKLSQLRPNMATMISINGGKVTRIEVWGPTYAGAAVAEVDVAKRSITVWRGEENARRETFVVDGNTRISVNGEKATLADIKPGMRPRIRVSALLATKVVSVEVGEEPRREEGERRGERQRPRVMGFERGKVAIAMGDDVKTYPLADGAKARIRGIEIPLAAVPKGAPVEIAWLRRGEGDGAREERGGTVREIHLLARLVDGRVSRVTREAITLDGREREDGRREAGKTFRLASGVRVMVNGRMVGLDAIRPGMGVLLIFARDGEQVLAIQSGRRPREGEGERERGDRDRDGEGERERGDRDRDGEGERERGDGDRDGEGGREHGDRDREADREGGRERERDWDEDDREDEDDDDDDDDEDDEDDDDDEDDKDDDDDEDEDDD